MTAIGYALLGEEHSALDLLGNAVRAEAAGFSFGMVSDHYHPWVDAQGESPFVWSVLGAIAGATDSMVLGTGVTCPTIRIHPAIIAQAAATMSTLAPGRFFLGVGSGENLNEHVLGDPWPTAPIRLRMLDEAITVIRELWKGEEWSFEGEFYTVEHARIYSRTEEPPPLFVAASGPTSATLAAESGDGIIATSPDEELIESWEANGGDGPRIGMLHLVYAESAEAGRAVIAEHWPHAPLPGHMGTDLRRPAEFEAASAQFRLEDYDTDLTPVGPDPEPVLRQIQAFEQAGFDHILMHQIGPDQAGFIRFFEEQLAPHLELSEPTLGG